MADSHKTEDATQEPRIADGTGWMGVFEAP